MKKLVIGFFVFFLIATQVSAQIPTFTKSDNVVNLGIGFGGSLYSGVVFGSSSYRQTPSFTAAYEHCVIGSLWDNNSSIGIGGLVGFSSIKLKNTDWVRNTFVVGARGALHYTFVDKLDTYAGLMMGVKFFSGNYTDNFSRFAPDFFVGARYYFSNNFAAFSELSYEVSYINLGVSLKF